MRTAVSVDDGVSAGGVSTFGLSLVNRSVIPHFGHFPGFLLVTSGCIGHS
jgi:hypothetical protein